MTRVYKLKVPNENMISRIISNDNLAHEIMVIDRTDKEFVNTYMEKLEKPALYILVNRETNKLYVGQTEDSLARLKNHEKKEFWTEAIVFHSKMNTLSTTEVRWLEAKTYEVVSELGYFDLTENIKPPKYPPLKEDQDIELEPVFEEAKRYICAAGFDIFMKKKDKSKPKDIPIPFNDKPTPKNGETWLICYDKSQFDVDGCFKKYGQINWSIVPSLKGVKAGDIAYLYSNSPEKAIRYKVEVLAAHYPYSPELAREDDFKKQVNHAEDMKKEYFLVKLLASTKAASLTLKSMIEKGVMGKRPSHSQLSQVKFLTRLDYIEQHFNDKDEWTQDTPKPKTKKTKPVEKPKKKPREKPRPPFRFSMIDLKKGDVVHFTPSGLDVMVASDREIEYMGKVYSFNAFCDEFLPASIKAKHKKGTFQGPDYFTFQGKKITKIRDEKEKHNS